MGRFGDEILSRLNTIVQERKALGGPSQRRLASLVGCSSAHMTHLLSGRSPLTLDWLEKICQALKIDPLRLVDDRSRLPLARSAYDLYDKPQAALHELLQGLLESGFDKEAAQWIESAHRVLKLCQAHFAQLVVNTGAEEGVLWRRWGNAAQAVWATTLEPVSLLRLKSDSRDEWQEFCVGEFEIWLKNPSQESRSQSELFLAMLSDLLQGGLG